MDGDRCAEPATVEMAAEAIDAYLGRGGTGVLSLARADEPYAVPVSYGYDPGSRRFYFRLGSRREGGDDGGGGKRDFLQAGSRARFVVYGPADGGWTSVIATGPLEPIEDDELTVEVANALREAELPLLEAWGRALDDVEFRLYRLTVEGRTGRTTATE